MDQNLNFTIVATFSEPITLVSGVPQSGNLKKGSIQQVHTLTLSGVYCLLSTVCCLLATICCLHLLSAVRCLLSAVCCVQAGVSCLLYNICCLLVPGVPQSGKLKHGSTQKVQTLASSNVCIAQRGMRVKCYLLSNWLHICIYQIIFACSLSSPWPPARRVTLRSTRRPSRVN
jgi:hypothetical protein